MKHGLASLAGAPLLWLAHFVAVYALASLTCAAAGTTAPGPQTASAWGVALLTLAALAAAGAGLLRNRRRSSSAEVGPERFLARTNLLLYALAAVAMLWVALPALLLPGCA